MSLSLFPIRVPIGIVDASGRVMMTPEFARALADLLQRVGGSDGMDSGDIYKFAANLAILEAFDAVPARRQDENHADISDIAQVAKLRAEVAQLSAELAAIRPNASLAAKLDEIRTMLEMQRPPARIVKRTATGSRGGNAALASALAALAASGLIIDSTTV